MFQKYTLCNEWPFVFEVKNWVLKSIYGHENVFVILFSNSKLLL